MTSGDHLEGWLFDLSAENDKAQRAVKKNKAGASGHFKHGIPVRLILLMCKKCRQPPEVRYQAIELYDHFMVRHVREVKRVWTAGGDGRTTWKAVVERLGHQVLLRVLTCIQIAGKLHGMLILEVFQKSSHFLLFMYSSQVVHHRGHHAELVESCRP